MGDGADGGLEHCRGRACHHRGVFGYVAAIAEDGQMPVGHVGKYGAEGWCRVGCCR